VKRLYVLAIIVVASLGVVRVASAHTASITITCNDVSFTFYNFSTTSPNTIHEQVTIDGNLLATRDFTFTGATGSNSIPITVPAGSHSVAATASWTLDTGGSQTFTQTLSGCNQSTVNRTTPSIVTTLSSGSVTAGTAVHDSATLGSATADAGGSVTYTVYTDSGCTAGAQSAGTKTVVNGAVPNSNDVVLTTVGDYYWQALYSGDTNNGPATSVCTSEHLVVTAATTTGGGGGETPTNAPVAPSTTTPATTPVATTPATTPVTTPPSVAPQTTTPTTTAPAKAKTTPTLKKPFKPPVKKKKVKVKSSPPPSCYTIGVGPKNMTVGQSAILKMRVTAKNQPIVGMKVSIKGAGIQRLSGPTNSSGQVTVTVHPRKAGLVTFRSASQRSCNSARVGVVAPFTPPVTG